MIYKWGFDGSIQGIKQIFKTQPDKTDADIAMASLAQLQLRCKRNESYFTIWEKILDIPQQDCVDQLCLSI